MKMGLESWAGTAAVSVGGCRRAALESAFTASEGRLLATALRIVHDPDAARDVVQSALERALRSLGSFRGEARLTTWLHRIVVNQGLMWLRARRRRARWETPLPDAAEGPFRAPDPAARPADLEERLDAARLSTRLGAALGALPASDRDVLLHCVAHETDYADYGARIGLHPLAVKTRCYRARHRLASLLREPAEAASRAPSVGAAGAARRARRRPR